jgi:riboflavin kinase/FMN adenylyltransferase
MKTTENLCALRRVRRPIVLAAGFFDGVHRGHQKVIGRAVARAAGIRGQAWVLTFDAHPLRILAPERAPLLLTSTGHKLRLLERLGVDGCLVIPFTRQLAGIEPSDFVERLARCIPSLREILVGGNWRFGRHGRGDARLLARLGAAKGFGVTVVRAVSRGGEPVSSTRIRARILRGRLAEAARMLGRPFGILATVVPGRSLGRRLGYPTANLDPHDEVVPPRGVYAVWARAGGRIHEGVLNFGVRPTLGRDRHPTLELHLLDFSASLYGREVEVFFVRRLRPERAFPSEQALTRQIAADVRQARAVLRAAKKRKNASLQPPRA